MFIGHPYVVFGEMSVEVFSFFHWVGCFSDIELQE